MAVSNVEIVELYLSLRGVPYEVVPHRRAFTSMTEAAALGVPPDEVLKTLVVDTRGGRALLVIPGSCRVEMRLVREAVGDPDARLANEWELEHDFYGYELGTLPPLGSLVGARTYVAPEVFLHKTVAFAAGSQTRSIRCRPEDLFRAEPIAVIPLTDMAREKQLVG